MKYVLTVEKGEQCTGVLLELQFDSGQKGKRLFHCFENEAIHFTVVNGELLFVSHARMPPGMGGYGSPMIG